MALVAGDKEKYDVLEVIGRGAFGIIRKVRRKEDGHILCRKEINYIKMSQKERDQLTAEFSILASLKHPNIVGYFHREHLKQTQELFLYMEYCGGGDLGSVIKELKRKNEYAKEEFVWRIFSQLITALYRCHYGVDAPEPGTDFSRQKDTRLQTRGNDQAMMILHRDLKPENIFLGEDQSVKLGDFGLSKLMQSHDFASTYVGTPFYMSPEICAAEKYTLHSDIWSVGCIMYELCTREPPFNANSHLQLVQRIRKGDFKPIPSIYSKDLASVISSCLKTNPTQRPDTASLLTVPYVWLARRQQEMVTIGKTLKTREEVAEQKLAEAEKKIESLEASRALMHGEIEAKVRREWELKARLEIDRQVQLELERLRRKFDKEVEEKAAALTAKHRYSFEAQQSATKSARNSSRTSDIINHHSSVNTIGEEDFPSSTDLTSLSELSLDSFATSVSKPLPPKKSKTPFSRSKTTLDSPADIHMSEPSPMSISSLALSPRRTTAAQATANNITTSQTAKNIFQEAVRQRARWEPTLPDTSDSDQENIFDEPESDDDDFPDLPSPTKPRATVQSTDPFKHPMPLTSKARPHLARQHTTATMQKLTTKPTLFPTTGVSSAKAEYIRAAISAANGSEGSIPRSATETDLKVLKPKATSPGHKLSKIPSRTDLRGISSSESTSPVRRTATTGGRLTSKLASAKDSNATNVPPAKVTTHVTGGGRTLVELAQARAGGRPMSAEFGSATQTNSATTGAATKHKIIICERELPPVPVWDPELMGDDMPSPFLKRDTRIMKGLR